MNKSLSNFYNKTKEFFKHNYKILLLFLIVSILNSFATIHLNMIVQSDDQTFHFSRIEELYQTFISGGFQPYIATRTANLLGSAVMSMYPKLGSYYFAILRLIFSNPVTCYNAGMVGISFLTSISCYYSYLSVIKNKLQATTFALIYITSVTFFDYLYSSFDLGNIFSFMIFPIAFAGLYHWLTKSKYKMLACGISLIILSHILCSLFTLCMFAILTLINIKKIDKQKLIALGKAIGLTVLITSSFWIPFMLFDFFSYSKLSPLYEPQLAGIDSYQLFTTVFTNQLNIQYAFSVITVIAIILGFIFYKKLNKLSKYSLWISFLTMLFSSRIVPWNLIDLTPVHYIQFTWRFYIFVQFFGSVLLANLISLLPQNKRKIRIAAISLLYICLAVSSCNLQLQLIKKSEPGLPVKKLLTYKNPYVNYSNVAYLIESPKQYNRMIKYLNVLEYWPINSLKVKNIIFFNSNRIITDKNKYIRTRLAPFNNGISISFKNKKAISKLELPFVLYNKNYTVTVDGKLVETKIGKHDLAELNDVSAGNHKVVIKFKTTLLNITILSLTIIGLVLLFVIK
ncbi:MAG: hypothetical protein Q3960_00220 [Lactobacillus sp.]|nr:hypothetical protein [Lactobacillus sp.]